MGRWFDLAERYVTAFETYSKALVEERRAQAERTAALIVLDERAVRAQERSADTVSSIQKLGEFMGSTIEKLASIETRLSCGPTPLAGEGKEGSNAR